MKYLAGNQPFWTVVTSMTMMAARSEKGKPEEEYGERLDRSFFMKLLVMLFVISIRTCRCRGFVLCVANNGIP